MDAVQSAIALLQLLFLLLGVPCSTMAGRQGDSAASKGIGRVDTTRQGPGVIRRGAN